MTAGDMWHVSGGMKPSRKAMWFKGGDTDDYVQINAAAVARTAANDTKGTWMAWVNMPNITGTFCIMCAGDDNVVEFIELNIEAGLLTARCTDGTTVQFVTQADQVDFTPHVWHHVAVVQRADSLGPHLFVNGAEIARTNDTTTDVNEWFNNCDGIDTMRIGAANKAGDASVTNEFTGGISNVRIYTDAKTNAEILSLYQYERDGVGSNNTTNLHNFYDFDNDLVDAGSGADNGTLVGTSATLCPNYCEFTSIYNTITTPVVADTCLFSVDANNVGHLVVIKAA
jgi:hypothetical protein